MINQYNVVICLFPDGGMLAVTCMTSVVVTALCTLSKRYLIMEGAAAGRFSIGYCVVYVLSVLKVMG